jgi:hypothetical protein
MAMTDCCIFSNLPIFELLVDLNIFLNNMQLENANKNLPRPLSEILPALVRRFWYEGSVFVFFML